MILLFKNPMSVPMLKEALVSHFRLGLVLDVVPSVVVGVPF